MQKGGTKQGGGGAQPGIPLKNTKSGLMLKSSVRDRMADGA